jgi:hypothetical protein
MLEMVGQVVHEDYHREFFRIRDHLVEKPLRAELDEHQGANVCLQLVNKVLGNCKNPSEPVNWPQAG